MDAFHKACGSTNLSVVEIKKKNRTILFDVCNHCDRLIESYEIDQNRICLNRAISNIVLSPKSDNLAKMIIESHRKF